ncbi:hypothetical protein E4U60_006761 [Claviceps pazoutovae]|uniref:Uncharacterized protein n=1 Tax=Claviceps pazoutovae TaxID=1649127 RepID=A0A9P7M6K6_9HYPO|nr:hypothetical protein E4U60_006761 [Claviceps pazoutovae]
MSQVGTGVPTRVTSEEQWFRLLEVFFEFVHSRLELRRAIAEARWHWLIDHDYART